MKRDKIEQAAPATPYGQVDDRGLRFPECRPGPNRWDEMTQEDFAKDFDYVINRQGSITVLDPKSEAALQWFYRHLPEDCPRWAAKGFVIEHRFVDDILEGMARDGLVSDEEFEYSMNAEDRDRHAGEDL
jgi:hypothetical protein